MNSAKKKKSSPLVPATEVISEGEESDTEPEPESEPEPDPEREPEPEPEPELEPEPTPAEASQPGSSRSLVLVRLLRRKTRVAERHMKVIERRWERKMKTYLESGN